MELCRYGSHFLSSHGLCLKKCSALTPEKNYLITTVVVIMVIIVVIIMVMVMVIFMVIHIHACSNGAQKPQWPDICWSLLSVHVEHHGCSSWNQ